MAFRTPRAVSVHFISFAISWLLFNSTSYGQTPIPGHAGKIVDGAGSALLLSAQSVCVSGLAGSS